MINSELLKQRLSNDLSRQELFETHKQLGQCAVDQKEYNSALEHFHQAQLVAETSQLTSEIPGIYLDIANVHISQKANDEAFIWLQKALHSLEGLDTNRYTGRIHYNLANSFNAVGDYEAAFDHFNIAEQFFRNTKNPTELARVLNNKGIAFSSRMDYAHAVVCFKESLVIREELHDESGISFLLGNIGYVYLLIGEHEKAREYLNKSLEVKIALNDYRGVSGSLCNLGELYRKEGEQEKALEMYRKAEHISHNHKIEFFLPNILHCIARLELELGNIELAIEYNTRALELYVERRDKAAIASCYCLFGKIYLENSSGNIDMSSRYLHDALELRTETKTPDFELYEALSQLYSKTGDYEKALKYYQEFHIAKETVLSEQVKKTAIAFDMDRKSAEREQLVARERALAESERRILNNILPEDITVRLIQGESPIADQFESVSVLFMDIVDFTSLTALVSAQQLVHLLNAIFSAADAVMREFGLEKIKTIGDAYMAVAGAPRVQSDHVLQAAKAALALRDAMQKLEIVFPDAYGDKSWITLIPEIHVRIGLHCGPGVAGVVGVNKFLYDMWGDAVNTAARMESHGSPGRVHVSEDFVKALQANILSDESWTIQARGEIEIKGKGLMKTYFIEKSS